MTRSGRNDAADKISNTPKATDSVVGVKAMNSPDLIGGPNHAELECVLLDLIKPVTVSVDRLLYEAAAANAKSEECDITIVLNRSLRQYSKAAFRRAIKRIEKRELTGQLDLFPELLPPPKDIKKPRPTPPALKKLLKKKTVPLNPADAVGFSEDNFKLVSDTKAPEGIKSAHDEADEKSS